MDLSTILPELFQQFIHKSKYARWDYLKKRRETWPETVKRYFDFFEEHLLEKCNYRLTKKDREELESAVLNLQTMPSMRALMTAGPALKRDNAAGYNCAFVLVDKIRALDEIMYCLLCGAGVGFSVERQVISSLPTVAEQIYPTETTIVVKDSKIGWTKAFKELISLLYTGLEPKWDLSLIRPAGTPLKTFGGRASGPEPLEELFHFTVGKFKEANGRQLNSLELHDIICKIGEVVVVGGVRRSALISLSNLTDDRMRKAKAGDWFKDNSQRRLANNSVAYTEKPEMASYMKEWESLYLSKSGERGIFNRVGVEKIIKRLGDRRNPKLVVGTNPCSEILMRSGQFCNLTEIIAREKDTFDDLKTKVRWAVILGTMQSSLTDFQYLSAIWKKNCEEERLLGVSITGIMDCEILNGSKKFKELPDMLEKLRQYAVEVNKEWAKKLGINPAAAITCVKPSGTVSSLVNSSAGIHARHSPYYIRMAQGDKKDSLSKFLIDQKMPYEEYHHDRSGQTWAFYFPIASPKNAIYADQRTAIEQLEFWKIYQDHWCEHKPSITVYIKEEEWMEVGAWVYKNFDYISGVAFLPVSGHIYTKQIPYRECEKEEFLEATKKMPKEIDWTKLNQFEHEDMTTGSQELACSGVNGCDIV